jgi:hypothetical protein
MALRRRDCCAFGPRNVTREPPPVLPRHHRFAAALEVGLSQLGTVCLRIEESQFLPAMEFKGKVRSLDPKGNVLAEDCLGGWVPAQRAFHLGESIAIDVCVPASATTARLFQSLGQDQPGSLSPA